MDITKEDAVGIGITAVVHAAIFLFLLFVVISVTPPDPPLPEGMEIDFGMSDAGSGNDIMAIPTGPVISPNVAENHSPVKPTQETPEEIMTSQTGEEAVTIPKPDKKPVQETQKPVETPKPVINQGALLPGKSNTGGQGSGNTPGNEGRLDGIPNGGKGGSGNNPNGIGDGTMRTNNGTRVNMAGRSVTYAPSFTYNEQEDGTVVVKVTIDKNGNVVNATTDGVRGSTTTNKTLHSLAIANSKKYRFDVKSDAAPEQVGYITFIFERK